MESPPLRRIAPATPAPRMRSLFAALTMPSTSISVMSPCWMRMRSARDFIIHFPAGVWSWLPVLRIMLSVIIHATARFAAQAAFLHVLLEQRIGTVFFAQCLVEIFQDLEADVEADEIHHFERAHGIVETELDGLIDVCGRGDAGFEHGEGFIADERVEA